MKPLRDTTQASSVVQIAHVLTQVGGELSDVARAIEARLSSIGPLLTQLAARDGRHLYELQEFDHIEQRLRGLSDFLSVLAPELPEHWMLDPSYASSRVTLAALAVRLGSLPNSPSVQEDAAASGDFEMF
jgi:hypothetical protein